MGAAAQADVQLRIVRKFPSHPLRRWSNMLDAARIKESCFNRSTQNEQNHRKNINTCDSQQQAHDFRKK